MEAAVVGRLNREDAADLLAPDTSEQRRAAADECEGLRARIENARMAYANGDLDIADLTAIKAAVAPKLEAAEQRARAVDDAPLLDGLLGVPDASQVWAGLPLSRHRAVVQLLMEVAIHRMGPGQRVFDPSSIAIKWR